MKKTFTTYLPTEGTDNAADQHFVSQRVEIAPKHTGAAAWEPSGSKTIQPVCQAGDC